MNISSEYSFPIFISSTDYNLKDLRAELGRFLTELGYRPIMSSAEGFPDNSPILEPWESCLPVLDKCFVMVLVIDGVYGAKLPWPNFKEVFNGNKLSPTAGEYFFAHSKEKRMLVFIRRSLMPHYQSFRTVMKKCNNDVIKAKEFLEPTLPEHVSFESLEFINMVKTRRPIPWINEFDDITCIKKEVQKKMLNELAELFLIKNKHFETVIDSFNKVMDSLSISEQKKVLQKVNATKEIQDAVEKLENLKNELTKTEEELIKAQKNNSKDKSKFEKKIKSLEEEIYNLGKETKTTGDSQFFINQGHVKYGNPNYLNKFFSGATINSSENIYSSLYKSNSEPLSYLGANLCDGCGKVIEDPHGYTVTVVHSGKNMNTCLTCNKSYCKDCWPKEMTSGLSNFQCPNCTKSILGKY